MHRWLMHGYIYPKTGAMTYYDVRKLGYLKKTGDSAKVVSRAQARAETKPGTVGIKVSILSPHAILKDRIKINADLIDKLKESGI